MIPPDDDWLLAGLTREPPVEHQRVASFPITLSQFFALCFMMTVFKFSFVSFPHWVINSLDLKCGILSTWFGNLGISDMWPDLNVPYQLPISALQALKKLFFSVFKNLLGTKKKKKKLLNL